MRTRPNPRRWPPETTPASAQRLASTAPLPAAAAAADAGAGANAGERGLTFIGVLFALLIVLGILMWWSGRLADLGFLGGAEGGGPVAIMGVAQQPRTMADMRAIARANDQLMATSGRYARDLEELGTGGFFSGVPTHDAWGNRFAYRGGGSSFTLTSYGADGKPGPEPPRPWTGGCPDCDLVMRSSNFTQAPTR